MDKDQPKRPRGRPRKDSIVSTDLFDVAEAPSAPAAPASPKPPQRRPKLVSMPPPKRSKSEAAAPAKRPTQPLVIPPKLLTRRVSEQSLASGNFQKKLIAGVAVQLSASALTQLHQAVESGNLQAIKMALEAVGIIQSRSAVSIINNNIDARQVEIDAREATTGRRSFETIARQLAVIGETRAQQPRALSIDLSAVAPTVDRELPRAVDEEE